MPTRRYRPGAIAAPAGPRLLAALAHEHARAAFSPRDVRDGARRVARVAQELELRAVLVRGTVDVGGAELDHVWAVIDDRVVDVPLPLHSRSFVDALRSYIAGDLDPEDLERAAHPHALDRRVVGEFPDLVRYYGRPFWGARGRAASTT